MPLQLETSNATWQRLVAHVDNIRNPAVSAEYVRVMRELFHNFEYTARDLKFVSFNVDDFSPHFDVSGGDPASLFILYIHLVIGNDPTHLRVSNGSSDDRVNLFVNAANPDAFLSSHHGQDFSTSIVLKARTSFSSNVTRNRVRGFCLLYTSPSPRDRQKSRMPSSA